MEPLLLLVAPVPVLDEVELPVVEALDPDDVVPAAVVLALPTAVPVLPPEPLEAAVPLEPLEAAVPGEALLPDEAVPWLLAPVAVA